MAWLWCHPVTKGIRTYGTKLKIFLYRIFSFILSRYFVYDSIKLFLWLLLLGWTMWPIALLSKMRLVKNNSVPTYMYSFLYTCTLCTLCLTRSFPLFKTMSKFSLMLRLSVNIVIHVILRGIPFFICSSICSLNTDIKMLR